jgi:hypothetical protein
MNPFAYVMREPDGTSFSYTPAVDLTTAGTRSVNSTAVTCNGLPGGCGADANLSIRGPMWLTGPTSPNISAKVGWTGSITIELITDQGVIQQP